MKNTAAVCPQPAAEAVNAPPDRIAPRDPPAQPMLGETALSGAPDRTVVRELHKMFALLAIR